MAGAMGRVAGLFLAGKGRRAGRRFQRTGRILPGCGPGVNPAAAPVKWKPIACWGESGFRECRIAHAADRACRDLREVGALSGQLAGGHGAEHKRLLPQSDVVALLEFEGELEEVFIVPEIQRQVSGGRHREWWLGECLSA